MTKSFQNLYEALQKAGGENWSKFSPDMSRLVLGVLRRLVEGNPLPFKEIVALAAEVGASEEAVTRVVEHLSERNQAGDIVGTLGLSQNGHPHQFSVNGTVLATWCAWDALFLPSLVGQTAEVTSTDPETKEPVHLTVAPDGVKDYSPEGASITIIVPETSTRQGPESVEEVWMIFCHHVHFFTSCASAESWASRREQSLHVLSPGDAFELGQLQFEALRRYA